MGDAVLQTLKTSAGGVGSRSSGQGLSKSSGAPGSMPSSVYSSGVSYASHLSGERPRIYTVYVMYVCVYGSVCVCMCVCIVYSSGVSYASHL